MRIRTACFVIVVAGLAHRATAEVTFTRDVVPIFQEKCQVCHRPGSSAPMSLVTYQDARPWARAIKQRVARRDMPPWNVLTAHGLRFKNDRSLTDAQIRTIVQWVDAGAPFGAAKDLPPTVSSFDDERWRMGTPDVIVSLPARSIPAGGSDRWQDYVVDVGLSEDRYVRAVETKPAPVSRPAVHHVITFVVDEGVESENYLSEYAVGKESESFPADTGRLLRAGAKLRVNVHDHPVGRASIDRMEIGLFLYPKSAIPKYRVRALTVGLLSLDDDLDIPPNSVTTHNASARLDKPVRIISFQPHMHLRGKAMTLEALRPDGARTLLGAVARFKFDAQTAYVYEDDVSPVLPAGTVLHATATFDNSSANRDNPDPNQWVGFGNRSIDEMFQCHVILVELESDEYAALAASRLQP